MPYVFAIVYLWGAVTTGCYLMAVNQPDNAGGWLAFCGLVLAWPALFAIAIFRLTPSR